MTPKYFPDPSSTLSMCSTIAVGGSASCRIGYSGISPHA
ncbi:hypothetical protein [Caudoviricetes sp.]|nr:hypothetical protein [Caudoviricetes sp.]